MREIITQTKNKTNIRKLLHDEPNNIYTKISKEINQPQNKQTSKCVCDKQVNQIRLQT